ncbi:MAG: hypothetical protein KDB22_04605 [Planctomycetales bacterium]|nr:hypothetical protein [Planctomycetales bacterium]
MKYYLIRLLLLVERESDLSDRDAGSWAAVSSNQQAGSFVPKAKPLGPSDYDDAVDEARVYAGRVEL